MKILASLLVASLTLAVVTPWPSVAGDAHGPRREVGQLSPLQLEGLAALDARADQLRQATDQLRAAQGEFDGRVRAARQELLATFHVTLTDGEDLDWDRKAGTLAVVSKVVAPAPTVAPVGTGH